MSLLRSLAVLLAVVLAGSAVDLLLGGGGIGVAAALGVLSGQQGWAMILRR